MTKTISLLVGILAFVNHVFSDSNKISQRPQEPTRPYPYHEEEVVFENVSDNVRLAGTLTWPRSQGPAAAVILLHGSAPLDRDSSLFGHKPFLVWADHLTRHGIAVLRFDKRSAGKSTGDYSTSTLENFASDALAAVAYLKTRKEIDVKKIGFIGHSEGGLTACFAASQSKDIAFVVLMAAPCMNWDEFILEQEVALQRVDGVSLETIEKNRQMRKQMFAVLKKENDPRASEMQLREILTSYLAHTTSGQRKSAETYYGTREDQIKFFNATWFRYMCKYDPAIALKQVTVPVLALNGELDFVVSTENLTRIDKVLAETGHKDYTSMKLPKLNHAFQSCQTGSFMECAAIEETAAPFVLNLMSDWILERTIKRN